MFTNGKANYVGDKILTLSGTIQDINQQKEIQEKLEQERSKTMQNAKLASLGEMSAGVAHEINNPLAIILGSTNILEKKDLDYERRVKVVEKVKSSVDRIAKIVSGLKKFSRNSEKIEKRIIKLDKVIDECISLIGAKAKKNRVEIKTTVPEEFLFLLMKSS